MYRSFKGFLQEYCNELSGLRTANLRKLIAATNQNARLVEPLFALAAVQRKTDYLISLSIGYWFQDDYQILADKLSKFDSIESFLSSEEAPARYSSVLEAFHAQGDTLAADRRINSLMRPKITDAFKSKNVTRYRLCKDLGLNLGNVYAYLAGDDTKVSKATARRMLNYLQG